MTNFKQSFGKYWNYAKEDTFDFKIFLGNNWLHS